MATAAAPSLVGRDQELTAVENALGSLDAREGGFFVVGGEPGIGKSRLLEELAGRGGQREWTVLSGRAAEFEREMPFAMWVDALDAYVGTLDEAKLTRLGVERTDELRAIFPSLGGEGRSLDVAEDRFRAHRAVRELLDGLAATRPLIVVLDDLHWADEASLELLAALARRPPERAVLLAAGHRPADNLDQLRAALDRAANATILELSPLAHEDAGRLVPSDLRPADRAALLAEGGGNPFYLQQLARAPRAARAGGAGHAELIEGGFRVPAGVAASIAEELAALPEGTRTLLQGAAIAGEPFDLWLAAAAVGQSVDDALEALDGAVAVELVRPTPAPGQFVFRHPLVRRAIYASGGEGFRLGAHRRAAAALAERGADAAVRAHHVARSAQPGEEEAIAVLVEAAEQRQGRAPASAATWYGDAVRLLGESGSDERRAELEIRRARAALDAGHLEDSHAALEAALAIDPEVGDAETISLIAEIELWLGESAAAEERLERAVDELSGDDPRAAALLGLHLLLTHRWNGRMEAAVERGQQALAAAKEAGDPAVLAAVEATFAELVVHVDTAAGGAMLDAAAARIEDLPDVHVAEAIESLYSLGWGYVHTERYDDAVASFGRAMDVARRYGRIRFAISMRSDPVEALMRAGRLADALAAADDGVDAARLHPSPRFPWWALWLRSTMKLRSGDVEGARADYEECKTFAVQLPPQSMLDLWMGYQQASLLAHAGDHEGAAAALIKAGGGGDDLPRIPINDRQVAWQILVDAAIARGDLEDAERWAREAEATAERNGLRGMAGFAARCRTALERARPDPAAAVAAADASVQAFRDLGNAFEVACSQVLLGECLIEAGRGSDAVPLLMEAEETLHGLGTERFRARAARSLRKLGRRTPARGGGDEASALESLSAREREIAELVHRQYSNRQIAEELFLSEKTVQTHLRNIFGKLGVSSRVAVALAWEQAEES